MLRFKLSNNLGIYSQIGQKHYKSLVWEVMISTCRSIFEGKNGRYYFI